MNNATHEIEYVKDFLGELTSVKETRKLWRAWSGILEHYVKAVSALRRATDQGASKKWSDSLLAAQRDDPILQYAHQARDHASHVFEGKREAYPRSVSVGGVISLSGNSSVTLLNNTVIGPDGVAQKLPDGNLITKEGRYAGGSISRYAISEHDHFVILNDVKTRSGLWKIPNPETQKSKQAIEIAHHVYEWLLLKLSEANELVKAEN